MTKRKPIFPLPTLLFAAFLFLILALSGCAGAPKKSIEAAQEAINRAKPEATSPACKESLSSAEIHLKKAKEAMERKNYEKAKTEVFDSLQKAYEAHLCAEENRKKEDLLEENSDG